MKKTKRELQVIGNTAAPMIPGIQGLSYAEKKKNLLTGALVETIKALNGDVAQHKITKTGGEIVNIIKAPKYSGKDERDASIRDFARNKIPQTLNAIAHDVSQSTVSKVVTMNKNT